MSETQAHPGFDINGIIRHQRNRYPVLLIDRVTAVDPGKSAQAVKCFTYNEWFFPGHFDDEPNVPGFVQIESLTQTFIMTFLCMEEYKGMKTNFVSINNVRFRRKIVPGDVLRIEAKLTSFKRGLAIGSVESFVGEEPACSGDFVVAVPDILDRYKPRS
ncbi:beta-hydroxyacyl-ACP dehydratase [Rhizobium rhizosphaerae]|uniref:Beta-hydroxyacyl-ACP dehydratase n=1 Tax=Xaviernesmea rhizosphaerae TaxID=1672749 RepID=A0A1Q9AE34_9HYPH|nr:3-hydroxyacyl-ACP dehydratase FabZ [Xaviernesmea rhizosphaerae]OLP53215.1 beta-hydroxyacyl-ACP dehydratase [Xaviernesmea rhizosphaerae]OQP85838.1 beta-hydroxyacyl-ACP dehydratase [Xaviernesmea rhizosphaerae]